MKKLNISVLAAAAALSASAAFAQAPAIQPVMMKQLKPDVWAGLGGSGGNSTIYVGKTGVIVVDAKQTEAGAKDLLAEIAKITPKPVTTVFLTHSDGDHVNGLVAYPASVKVIAHENNKKEQEAAIAAGGRGAPPPDRLPSQVVAKNKETTTIDGVKLELYHWGPAHTSGDLIVYNPQEKVVSTGDIVVTNRADDNPNIHMDKNGSVEGWMANVKGMVGLNADYYVTGHGDVLMKADLQRKLTAVTERRNKIAAMVKQGKSLEEIKSALPDSPAPGARGSRAAGRWTRARTGLRGRCLCGADEEENNLTRSALPPSRAGLRSTWRASLSAARSGTAGPDRQCGHQPCAHKGRRIEMGIERREKGRRAEVVRAVVDHVVHKAETSVTLEGLQEFLHIPQDAAGRIVSSLVNAGIVREVRAGLWQRVPDFPGAS